MPRKKRISSKFFPFSPGIPWKIERGKYILPQISSNIWNQVLVDKNIVITVPFGGLLESFFSLSVAEALNFFDGKNHKVFWLGPSQYSIFPRLQNLSTICYKNITKEILEKYPAPIFFDQQNNVYINILHNYLTRYSYWGLYPEPVDTPILFQIFKNMCIPFDKKYIPHLRKMHGISFADKLYETNKLRPRNKFVLIILDENSTENTLNWSVRNIKEFNQLATTKRLKTVVFTKNINKFYGSNILCFEYNIKNILDLISKSWMILSNKIDWTFIGMVLSGETHLVARETKGPYDLFSNAELISAENSIFTDRNPLSPIDVFSICEGLL